MRLQAVAGIVLGFLVPLLYWLGTWFSITPIVNYHDWFRAIHLPEWIMWPLIPWASIHLAIIVFDNRLFRRSAGPVMFTGALLGNVMIATGLAHAIDDTWGGETNVGQVIAFALSSLLLDALPAATATLLGWRLGRQKVGNRRTDVIDR